MTDESRAGAVAMEEWTAAGPRYSGVSRPIRVRHEVEWLDGKDGTWPLVTFYYGERWLSVWAYEPREILDGELDRALAGDVRLMVSVESFTGEYLEGTMHALPVARPGEPVDELGLPAGPFKVPFLGAVKHTLPRRYGPEEGARAAIDAVLFYLYGRAEAAVERLLLEETGRDSR